jgi:phage terminase large subunit
MKMNKAYLPYLEDRHRINIFYGGRGSGKSVFIAQREILKHLREPGHKTLVVRKVGRTNRDSTFQEIKTAYEKAGLQGFFSASKTDLRITCNKYNSEIIFAGLDDPEKLKSFSGVTDIWGEETTEDSRDDFDQMDMIIRGESEIHKQITLSFNPINALHWIKKELFDRHDDDVTILKTTYKDNAFLDKKYIERLKKLKEKDIVKYNVYALGEWGILGNLIYTNYVIKEFDEKELNQIYNGLDWGYNDPAAGLKMALKDDVIYIIDEFYVQSKDTEQLQKTAEEIFTKNDTIIADSSEPRTIADWQKAGWWNLRGAVKGQDSVRHGIGWIRERKIIIHPRCQNFINEIQCYNYRKDRLGNILEEPVDINNHAMDAMRYGLEPVMLERSWSFV